MKTRIFTLIVSLFITTMAFASVEIDGIYYTLDSENKTATVTFQYFWDYGNYSDVSNITIPSTISYEGATYSVTSIGNSAFSYCSSLTSITIPNSVTSIEYYAFGHCPELTNIVVESGNRVYDSRDNCNAIIETSSNTLIQGCKNTIIPNSVTSIGDEAFSNCSSLTTITIPNSVTSIGGSAFYGCSSLTSISIPNSVTSIDNYTFRECSSLTSVTIPNSVTFIGTMAFAYCSSLTELVVEATNPPSLGDYVFEEVSKSIPVKVPCGVLSAYQTADGWKDFVNFVELTFVLTVEVNDATMGFATVTKQNSCDDNIAQVQAQAKAGYKFVRWSDGSTDNPHIVLVEENMTITAEFAKEGEEPEDKPEGEKHNNFIVESADATQGSVIITITAQPIEGFEFSHWSDGNTENPRNITLDKDVELYAHFRIKGTGLENSVISSANVYANNGVLYVEGAKTDYYILDMSGRLIYSGRDTQVQLPRGVYVININGEIQKVVL